MSPVLGEVKGAVCPKCKTELELGEEFYEGQEVDCDCGTNLIIQSVKAVYTVKLQLGHTYDDARWEVPGKPP